VKRLFRSLQKNRRLLAGFVVRDLRARYVGSSMGFFWSVIFPFLNLFIYMFVFNTVLGIRFGDKSPVREVALWMLAGITVWQAFAETISRTTNTLVENQNLIQKIVFPSELLPVYLTISSLINMGIGMAIVIVGVVWFGYIRPSGPIETASLAQGAIEVPYRVLQLGLPLVTLPLLVALQSLFTLALGYFLAAFNLFLRDTYHLMGVFITIWMFATPIFYPPEQVISKGFGWMLQINPMYWLISSYRDVVLFGTWPDWVLLGRFALIAAALFLAGSRFFMAQKPRFPDLL
jgi:ABC-type polysaccharide/polyol phosphate export permease